MLTATNTFIVLVVIGCNFVDSHSIVVFSVGRKITLCKKHDHVALWT